MSSRLVHTVYVYRDGLGRVIYVGVTGGNHRRTEQHAKKVWWPLVASAEFSHYSTRELADRAEVDLIRLWRPPFNVRDNPGGLPYEVPAPVIEWALP